MGKIRKNSSQIDRSIGEWPVRLKKIFYLSSVTVIPVSISICYGKAVAAPDMGADDRVTWGPGA
jgi:hypothetical protein